MTRADIEDLRRCPRDNERYEHSDGSTIYIYEVPTPNRIWISHQPVGRAEQRINLATWRKWVDEGRIRGRL